MAKKEDGRDSEKKGGGDLDLIEAACNAYGIEGKYLLGSRISSQGLVSLVTVGGAKVFWKPGEDVIPLSVIQITGENPAKRPRKPVAGTLR